MTPQININGDTFRTLCDQYHGIYNSFDELITAMAKGTPHGRNYYTNEAYREAREQFDKDMSILMQMRKKYEDVLFAILEQES